MPYFAVLRRIDPLAIRAEGLMEGVDVDAGLILVLAAPGRCPVVSGGFVWAAMDSD
jgi:hypothetical protein